MYSLQFKIGRVLQKYEKLYIENLVSWRKKAHSSKFSRHICYIISDGIVLWKIYIQHIFLSRHGSSRIKPRNNLQLVFYRKIWACVHTEIDWNGKCKPLLYRGFIYTFFRRKCYYLELFIAEVRWGKIYQLYISNILWFIPYIPRIKWTVLLPVSVMRNCFWVYVGWCVADTFVY